MTAPIPRAQSSGRLIRFLRFLSVAGLVLAVITPVFPLLKLKNVSIRLDAIETMDRLLAELASEAQILYVRQYYPSAGSAFIDKIEEFRESYRNVETVYQNDNAPERLQGFWLYMEPEIISMSENLRVLNFQIPGMNYLALVEQYYEYKEKYLDSGIDYSQFLLLADLIDQLVFFSTSIVPQGVVVLDHTVLDLQKSRQDAFNSIAIPFVLLAISLLSYLIMDLLQRLRSHRLAGEVVLEQNRLLEEQVQERTAELLEKNRKLEETRKMMVEREKMAALGQLVAGVAHEVNTPLGVAVTATSFIVDEINNSEAAKHLPPSVHEAADLALSNLNRAAQLIRGFKRVAVDQTGMASRNFDLMSYLREDLVPSISLMLKGRLHLVSLEGPAKLEMNGYPGYFSQIISNLVDNSSLHGYGTGIPGTIRIIIDVDGDQLKIEVSDEGKGIDEEIRQQIFEPFFTTGRAFGGSGLGLMVVYNIVNGILDGNIELITETGKGSSFIVVFSISKLDSMTT